MARSILLLGLITLWVQLQAAPIAGKYGWVGRIFKNIFFLIFIESQVFCRCWQVPGCCLVSARGAVVGVGWDEPGDVGLTRVSQ